MFRKRPDETRDIPHDTEERLAARRASAALQRTLALEQRGETVGATMREMNSANHITELFVSLFRGV